MYFLQWCRDHTSELTTRFQIYNFLYIRSQENLLNDVFIIQGREWLIGTVTMAPGDIVDCSYGVTQ